MQLRLHATLAAIALILATGCKQETPTGAPAPAPLAVSSQLEAALAITNPIQRDEALKSVAQTAAEAGDGGIAMAAVVAIANPQLKDDAAVVSVGKLAKAGRGAEATAMAKGISNPIRRDQTLLEISKL